MQPPNSVTIIDAKMFLLIGVRYGCLLSGSVRTTLTQLKMLTANQWTESMGTMMEELEKGWKKMKGFRTPWEKLHYQPTK